MQTSARNQFYGTAKTVQKGAVIAGGLFGIARRLRDRPLGRSPWWSSGV